MVLDLTSRGAAEPASAAVDPQVRADWTQSRGLKHEAWFPGLIETGSIA